MSDQRDGGISWTDETWNPIRGCSRVSEGCRNCYAERVAARFSGPGLAYEGLARRTESGEARWTGVVKLVPEHLADPLRWKRPRRIFVNSMSDLFHEGLSNEDIAAIFGVMAAAPQHTFQVLTKRAERMRRWFEWVVSRPGVAGAGGGFIHPFGIIAPAADSYGVKTSVSALYEQHGGGPAPWPLPNVHVGVSVENQAAADERIPKLLECPAAVRWVSYEPALEGVTLREPWLHGRFIECPDETQDETTDECLGCDGIPRSGQRGGDPCGAVRGPKLDWIVIGGESGPDARPFDLAWARSTIGQCREAGTKVFVKQDSGPKSGRQGRIPDDLWLKEFPR